MKKILWITNNWLYEFGGRKIASKRIINFFVGRGDKITVFDFELKVKKSNFADSLIELDKRVDFKPYFINSYRDIISTLRSQAYKYAFDVVIFSGFINVDLLSFISTKIFGLYKTASLVLFEHNNSVESTRLSYFVHRYLFKAVGFVCYRFFDHVIVPGIGIKTMLIKNYGVNPNKITVIYYPVITNNINNMLKERIHDKKFSTPSRVRIITAARLNLFQKDFVTLFRAFKLIREKISTAHLLVLGEGPDEKEIHELTRTLGIKNQVSLLGFKKNPYKYFARSDLFILSSHFEGSPLVLIEAMACSIPVISTNTDYGPPEIITDGKNGLLVPPGEHKLLASAALKILGNNTLKNTLRKNGLKHLNKYSENKSLLAWKNFISKIS